MIESVAQKGSTSLQQSRPWVKTRDQIEKSLQVVRHLACPARGGDGTTHTHDTLTKAWPFLLFSLSLSLERERDDGDDPVVDRDEEVLGAKSFAEQWGFSRAELCGAFCGWQGEAESQ